MVLTCSPAFPITWLMVPQLRWIMTDDNHPSSSTSSTPSSHPILAKLKVKFSQGELLDVNPTATAAIARKR